MPLQLEIVSEHRDIVGDDAVRQFGEDGGTIGRSLQNDWILPDPDRFISGRHATIDHKGGIYYLVDTSTNGVYLNGDCEPIGKGNPRRLFDGDTLRFGDFEMKVSIDSGESLQMPGPITTSRVHADVEQQVAEVSLRTGVQLLDEEALTGDDEFQSALFGDRTDVARMDESEAENESDLFADDNSLEELVPVTPPKAASAADADLVDSFFDGLGINRAELHPSVELAEVMQNAGEVLKEFVEGASNLLASRANLKTSFRLDQTTVLPRHNNPLKLATNTNDSIKQLLVGKEGEYLGPQDAVREVCRDLLFHQDAFLGAMNSAFSEFADRFEPDELEQGFQHSLGSNPLARLFAKSKYWDLYCDQYPILTEHGGGRFPQVYAEEFVRAYELQIAEYKRLRGNDTLRETVKLDNAHLMAAAAEMQAEDNSSEELEFRPVAENDELAVTGPLEFTEDEDLFDDMDLTDADLFGEAADQAKG